MKLHNENPGSEPALSPRFCAVCLAIHVFLLVLFVVLWIAHPGAMSLPFALIFLASQVLSICVLSYRLIQWSKSKKNRE